MNQKTAEKYLPKKAGNENYVPSYVRKMCAKFSPKKAIRSFRDLEVYQETLKNSVIVAKFVIPELEDQKYPLTDGLTNCTLSIPLYIAEAHGMRFADFDRALATLERAMQGCNKTIVYLEQSINLYPKDLDTVLMENLMKSYITVRGKMLRLQKSWKRFKTRTTN